jgi:hypothetical protein
MADYFSDREKGPRARTEQVISPTVWAGLAATVQALVNSGAFGLRFPARCPDGHAVCGSDPDALAASVTAEMPGLNWPLEATRLGIQIGRWPAGAQVMKWIRLNVAPLLMLLAAVVCVRQLPPVEARHADQVFRGRCTNPVDGSDLSKFQYQEGKECQFP